MIENSESTELENNQYFSQNIKETLNLNFNPVAIKFVLHKEDIPTDINRIDEKMRHCEMVQKASKGEVFYSISDDQLCKGGSSAIGLEEIPDNIASGEFYYNLGRFKTIGSAKRTIDSIPMIDLKSFAIIYSPLEKVDYIPDIVVIFANPTQAMKISQALVYTLGGRVEVDFSGIQSVCADVVSGPFNKKIPNISLGCSGSRQYADIKDDELVIGLNGENLGCTVNALNSI